MSKITVHIKALDLPINLEGLTLRKTVYIKKKEIRVLYKDGILTLNGEEFSPDATPFEVTEKTYIDNSRKDFNVKQLASSATLRSDAMAMRSKAKKP